ncbi:TNFAIP3-interacting protein 2 [Takifugu rubripes]|uniref:TNFAIP3 interacting protein 2 n=1 Tax=Takifugu rubripes TaxID=31033 RepID=H2SYF2_TAKRU|nr:TNFAIP3-interacting protein 2 [Takifugu rubripes]|eukprot:XP_003972361.1 PREDICTED: TNFAIP3-interacting protein 2 [Takifugu rubripes]
MDKENINDEHDAPRDKLRSYSTLNSLYHDTQQEIELLNKQIQVKDNIISELKVRLGRYESIYLTAGKNEPVVIGPSKCLLESLCKEVWNPQQKLKDMEQKSSRQAEEIERLKEQIREKELELERVKSQPGHEKDQEIHRLHSALVEKERCEATRAVLCSSLAEEADQLRVQLSSMVQMCQNLLIRLETGNDGGGTTTVVAQQPSAKAASEFDGVNIKMRELQEENEQLKQRVAYVQNLNSQWQKYDSSRQDYIRSLCHRPKETPSLGSVSTGMLHHEISRLNNLMKEKMSECERLERELESTRRQSQERMQTLEQQVFIYEEDFRSERADRERAHGEIADLKEQVGQLRRQLHKQGAGREPRELIPVCRVHIGHRITSRRHKDSSEPVLRSTAEVQQKPAASVVVAAATAEENLTWHGGHGLSDLQCPRCLATFSDRETTEYLNHCEECAKL